jgi:hypothetical protein
MVRKIWAFAALGEKWLFQKVPWVYLEFTECLEGLSAKRQGHRWKLDNFLQFE